MTFYFNLFFIFLIAIFGCERPKGFSPKKIYSTHPHEKKWDFPFSNETISETKEILNQPFYFLGSGTKCYAFLSKDRKYVIKFFKQNHMKFPSPIKKNWREIALNHNIFRNDLFQSCLIAYKQLREETGVLFIHLTSTNYLRQKIHIYDQKGKNYQFPLDKMEFIIQKYAHPIFEQINTWMKENREDKAEQAILNILSLIKNRYRKHLLDKDINCRNNIALIDTKAIEIDIGEFRFAPPGYAFDEFSELFNSTFDLRLWLKEKHPSLAEFLIINIDAIQKSP